MQLPFSLIKHCVNTVLLQYRVLGIKRCENYEHIFLDLVLNSDVEKGCGKMLSWSLFGQFILLFNNERKKLIKLNYSLQVDKCRNMIFELCENSGTASLNPICLWRKTNVVSVALKQLWKQNLLAFLASHRLSNSAVSARVITDFMTFYNTELLINILIIDDKLSATISFLCFACLGCNHNMLPLENR